MTMQELEKRVARIEEAQKRMVDRQQQIEQVLIEMNKSITGIRSEIEFYSRDQIQGKGALRSIINTCSSSSVGIAMICFLILHFCGGTL